MGKKKGTKSEDRAKLEQDFAGEFNQVRKSGLEVNADKLIDESRNKKVTGNIKLVRIEDTDGGTEEEEEENDDDDDDDDDGLIKEDAKANEGEDIQKAANPLKTVSNVKPNMIRLFRSPEVQELTSKEFTSLQKKRPRPSAGTSPIFVNSSTFKLPKLIKIEDEPERPLPPLINTTPRAKQSPGSISTHSNTLNSNNSKPKSSIPDVVLKMPLKLIRMRNDEPESAVLGASVPDKNEKVISPSASSSSEEIGDSDEDDDEEFFDASSNMQSTSARATSKNETMLMTSRSKKSSREKKTDGTLRTTGKNKSKVLKDQSVDINDNEEKSTQKDLKHKKAANANKSESSPRTTSKAKNTVLTTPTEDQIEALKQLITKKLRGVLPHGPYEIDDKIQDIYRLLSATVYDAEKNSCFVIGPRNSGKTVAFDAAIRKLRGELERELEDIDEEEAHEKDFIMIKISGFVQNTDQQAVRAIAGQLDSEISRIYNVNLNDLEMSQLLSRTSISQTFANILKILDDEARIGQSVGKIKNPIIFAIDEVDVFANQNRQTLLYNLFDLAENSSTPVCVICFTSKFTVKELLEKRVRSRYSQRSIQFRKLNQEKFLRVILKLMSVDEPNTSYELEWNERIEALLRDKKSNLRQLTVYNTLTSNNIKEIQNLCVYPVSKISQETPFLNDEHLMKYVKNQLHSSWKNIVNSLSDLELSLLVSATRVIAKTDMSWINLNVVYEEYLSQVKAKNKETTLSTGFSAVASTGFKVWSKESCKLPWESLQNVGLLTVPNSSVNRTDYSNSNFETRSWEVELTIDELRVIVDAGKPVKSWTRL